MPETHLSRRIVLQAALGTGVAAAGVVGAPRPSLAAGPLWKKFAGTSLDVLLEKGPRGDLLEKYVKEFTELTGIRVSSGQSPEQHLRQRVTTALQSGRPGFDVVDVRYHVQKRQFDKAGWLADLSAFMADPTLTAPDLVREDFSAAGQRYAANADDELRSLPWSVDYWILYWNKELFARKNLRYPETFEDMVAAAEALTDPKEGHYGFVARGLRNANVPVWSSFLLGYGGDFLDAQGNLLSDSAESIAAARLYQRLLTKSAPPGVAAFNWAECQSAFLQGKVAMWLDGIGFAPAGEDPQKSRIVGKIGYGVMPKGPGARASATFGSGLGVAQASNKKEAAYLYCQWAVSKLMGARLLQSGAGVPFRHSVLADAETRKGISMPAEWIEAVAQSARISRLGLPSVVPVTAYRESIGAALSATLAGADPAAEMKKATEHFRPVLMRSEKS
ncbi:MAG: sugar ABC transporter substrate-binding protein [Pseudorhodoplanes sp.]